MTIAASAAGQITGTLRSPAGQPVGFANVTLLRSADSATVRTTTADSLGHYRFEPVTQGSYFLRGSSIGYRAWQSPVFEGDSARDMGIGLMAEDKQQLDAAVVRGRPRPVEQTIEGTIVHAESSILTKGSSMLEVLERSPGVQVDQHNNTITLNGKNGVTVMINGKMLQLPENEVVNMLASMPADNLDRLELLTTPPAKYDASGNAGMINIVLKKGRSPGTNGSFTLGGGYGGIGEKGNASINIDHNTGRADWYASYAYTHDRTGSNFHAYGSQIVAALGGPDDWQYQSVYRHTDNNHAATAGLDLRPGRGFTLGGSATYNFSGTSGLGHNTTIYTLPPDSVLSYDGTGYGYSHWNNLILSFHAERTGHKGGKLGMAADWIDFANNRPTHVEGSFVNAHGEAVSTSTDSLFSPAQLGFSTTGIRVGVGKIDYSKPFGDRWRFETGVKGTYTTSSSSSGIESLINGHWVTSLGSVDAIAMHEGIGAGYTSAHAVLTARTTLDLGVRYEYSRTRLSNARNGAVIDDRKLGVFFPNLLFTQKLDDHSQLQLSYSKRITRPSYKDLSSYIVYNDPLSVFSGNPLLKPAITNNLKLGYTNKGYAFSVLLSRDDNPIIDWAITAQPGSQLIYIRPENLQYQNYLTFEANLPFTVNDWWEMSYDLIGGWRRFEVGYLPVPAEKTYFGFTLNFRETFKLPAAFTAELSGFYNGPDYYGPFRNEGYGSVNIGLKKQLSGNRGSLQFSATDVLRSMEVVSKVGLVGTDAFDSRAYSSWNAESRQFPIVKLTYTRSFGTGQKTHNEQGTSGEERARIK
jgi:hypothetical protein